MLLGSRRLSVQIRLSSPSGWMAIHGKNWSVAFVSSLTFTGADQVLPRFFENASRTSALVHGGLMLPSFAHEPLEKSTQATKSPPPGAMAAVGKVLERIPRGYVVSQPGSSFFSRKNPGLGRLEATAAGLLQVLPPSADLENLMLVGPVTKTMSA